MLSKFISSIPSFSLDGGICRRSMPKFYLVSTINLVLAFAFRNKQSFFFQNNFYCVYYLVTFTFWNSSKSINLINYIYWYFMRLHRTIQSFDTPIFVHSSAKFLFWFAHMIAETAINVRGEEKFRKFKNSIKKSSTFFFLQFSVALVVLLQSHWLRLFKYQPFLNCY